MTTDDLIREALAKQADLAPPPHAMLAALARRRRNRTPLVIAVLVTASALVAVAAVITRQPAPVADPAVTQTPTSYTGKPPRPDTKPDYSLGEVPLRYEPGWLPDGFVEQFRELYSGGIYTRQWRNPADPEQLVAFSAKAKDGPNPMVEQTFKDAKDDRVDLGALGEGRYALPVEPQSTTLLWRGADDRLVWLRAKNLPDPREVLPRIAKAMRTDGKSVHGPVLEVAAPYAGNRTTDSSSYTSTGTSPTDWTVTIATFGTVTPTEVRLSSDSPDTTGGTPVRARGTDATFVPARQVGDDWTDVMVVVPVGDLFLTIAGKSFQADLRTPPKPSAIPLETLVATANATTVADHVDVSWFGKR
ncbi:hypothetical protein [Umezawaea sp. NPDC059074]|uniref:hypothetical protein n=1 Tax=Umezawaea sp. NPDC059074 TaxID=3346716 RepID=UPI00369FD255